MTRMVPKGDNSSFIELCLRCRLVDLFAELHASKELHRAKGGQYRKLTKLVVTDDHHDMMLWRPLGSGTLEEAARELLPAVKKLRGK